MRKYIPFVLAFIVFLMMFLYAWFGMEWFSADILGAKLPAGCEMFFYGKDEQMVFTIAIGCPGKDLVRIWPLPIINPWFEDWWHKIDGDVVG